MNTAPTFADGSCFPLNNGGITTQQFCPTPTSTPIVSPQPATNNQQQKNNGGQQVYPPSQTKTTPNTGPEDWVLPTLFLIGGLGFWLRKKTKLL